MINLQHCCNARIYAEPILIFSAMRALFVLAAFGGANTSSTTLTRPHVAQLCLPFISCESVRTVRGMHCDRDNPGFG